MKALITGSNWKIGIAAAYSLARNGVTVIGTDEHKLPLNIHSRHLKAHYFNALFSQDQFFDDIISIIKKEKPDVLLPIAGTKQISLHKSEIKKYVKLLVPDYESYIMVYDKKHAHKLCTDVGIAVPNRYSDEEANSILKNAENLKLVIKPDFDIGGAKGLSIVSSINHLNIARKYIESISSGYVIEEYIPGAMYAVQILFDKKNRLLEYFILKKIHQWPVTGGITAYAISKCEYRFLEFFLPFFEKCPWEGPVEAELIIDERNGSLKLIEINPRFAGSIAFAIQCGINFPLTACRAAVSEHDFEITSNYEPGIFYINTSYYLKAILKEFRSAKSKSLFINQILKELKQKKVSTLIDRRDFPVYIAKAINELKTKIT